MMHIIGASGHAKVVLDILKLNNEEVSGVWDDNIKLKSIYGYPVFGTISAFLRIQSSLTFIAIGNNEIRKTIAQQITGTFHAVVHPASVISTSAKVREGSVIMPNVSINSDVTIGKHVIVNTNASVDHDCIIEDFVHISPQVALAGNVHVGEGTHIGIGASVIQGIKIGAWATIGAGAVIIRDVPDYAVVVGNPGKIIKYNCIE